jgi:PAS domain S-box-containing protein
VVTLGAPSGSDELKFFLRPAAHGSETTEMFDWWPALLERMTGGGGLAPDGVCLNWDPSLLALHAVSELLTALAYFVIPAAIVVFLRKRRDLPSSSRRLAFFFILFIGSAGLTHLAAFASYWVPIHGVTGILKALTASLSVATAAVIWPLIPQMLRVPSPARLQAEMAAHVRTLDELRAARAELEERVARRTAELAEAQKRLEIALRGSPITIAGQDRENRYAWVHNPPGGAAAEDMIGRTDADLLPPEPAARLAAAKREVMELGRGQTVDITFERNGRTFAYDLTIDPLRDDMFRVVGATSVSVDVSERKRSEDHLRLLLRELTHRSKNLLAVIQAIARQTASRTRSVDDFLDHFSARLASMGSAHDLLVAENWTGASLRDLIATQLDGHAQNISNQVRLDGDDVILTPEATQNVGLALHELATNAMKYGALSTPTGEVDITWAYQPSEKGDFRLIWEETGGPAVTAPAHRGFGRTMIEKVVGQALGGKVTLEFPEGGVRCVIDLPSSQIAAPG